MSGNLLNAARIYQKQKKILKINIFLFKVYTDLKSWSIIPKSQLSTVTSSHTTLGSMTNIGPH